MNPLSERSTHSKSRQTTVPPKIESLLRRKHDEQPAKLSSKDSTAALNALAAKREGSRERGSFKDEFTKFLKLDPLVFKDKDQLPQGIRFIRKRLLPFFESHPNNKREDLEHLVKTQIWSYADTAAIHVTMVMSEIARLRPYLRISSNPHDKTKNTKTLDQRAVGLLKKYKSTIPPHIHYYLSKRLKASQENDTEKLSLEKNSKEALLNGEKANSLVNKFLKLPISLDKEESIDRATDFFKNEFLSFWIDYKDTSKSVFKDAFKKLGEAQKSSPLHFVLAVSLMAEAKPARIFNRGVRLDTEANSLIQNLDPNETPRSIIKRLEDATVFIRRLSPSATKVKGLDFIDSNDLKTTEEKPLIDRDSLSSKLAIRVADGVRNIREHLDNLINLSKELKKKDSPESRKKFKYGLSRMFIDLKKMKTKLLSSMSLNFNKKNEEKLLTAFAKFKGSLITSYNLVIELHEFFDSKLTHLSSNYGFSELSEAKENLTDSANKLVSEIDLSVKTNRHNSGRKRKQ